MLNATTFEFEKVVDKHYLALEMSLVYVNEHMKYILDRSNLYVCTLINILCLHVSSNESKFYEILEID
jgi:hypothetical protein